MASRSLLRLFQIVSLPCGMLHGVDSWVSAGVFPRYRNIHEHCFRDRKTGSRAPLRVYSRRRWLHGEPITESCCVTSSPSRASYIKTRMYPQKTVASLGTSLVRLASSGSFPDIGFKSARTNLARRNCRLIWLCTL